MSEARRAADAAKAQGMIINAVGLAPAPGGEKLLKGLASPGLYDELARGPSQLGSVVSCCFLCPLVSCEAMLPWCMCTVGTVASGSKTSNSSILMGCRPHSKNLGKHCECKSCWPAATASNHYRVARADAVRGSNGAALSCHGVSSQCR